MKNLQLPNARPWGPFSFCSPLVALALLAALMIAGCAKQEDPIPTPKEEIGSEANGGDEKAETSEEASSEVPQEHDGDGKADH